MHHRNVVGDEYRIRLLFEIDPKCSKDQLAGVKSNITRVNDLLLKGLNRLFDYLLQLSEVRATRVIATLVDGVAGCTN